MLETYSPIMKQESIVEPYIFVVYSKQISMSSVSHCQLWTVIIGSKRSIENVKLFIKQILVREPESNLAPTRIRAQQRAYESTAMK